MPPWFTDVSSLQRKESKFYSSRWMQLATIGLDKSPRVRTVVFRGWTENFEMEIYTDNRSQKSHELYLNNNVEICWLFARSRCQFRFRGNANIEMNKEIQRHWEQLSEENKAMWSWPSPGENYSVKTTKDLKFTKNKEIPSNFSLIKIEITQVDHLLLHKPIHLRKRWILKNEWIMERINP